jgi:DNA-directed RNA polymerase subunit RPC12/RpoP
MAHYECVYRTTMNSVLCFCPHCGNRTLAKVSVTVGEDGTLRYHFLSKKQFSHRGLRVWTLTNTYSPYQRHIAVSYGTIYYLGSLKDPCISLKVQVGMAMGVLILGSPLEFQRRI